MSTIIRRVSPAQKAFPYFAPALRGLIPAVMIFAMSQAGFGAVPSAVTHPPAWSDTTVLMKAMVNPNDEATSVWFRWGTNGTYLNSSTPVTLYGGSVHYVSGSIAAPSYGQAYQYQVVASNSSGVVFGMAQKVTLGKTMLSWGYNYSTQTNFPSLTNRLVSIAVGGSHSLALVKDGKVFAWGSNLYKQTNVPPGLDNVAAISAGYYHSLALKKDGSVVGWGNNQYGQTNIPSGLNNVVSISCGTFHNLALKSDGTVVAWGGNFYLQTNVPSEATNIVAIAAGRNHSLALRSDGKILGWGDNLAGQITAPEDLTNAIALAAGSLSSTALKNDGTVSAWGSSAYGQIAVPEGLAGVVAIAQGDNHTLALKVDGSAVGWGYDYYGQADPPPAHSNLVAIAAGGDRSLAIVLGASPVANNKVVSTLANQRIIIKLTGYDPDGDPITFRIVTLPQEGTLYQYDHIGRVTGSLITNNNTIVTDPDAQVVFLSATNGSGSPSFRFVVNDGISDSAPGTVVINLVGPATATTLTAASVTDESAVLRGMVTANTLPTVCWFEWGNSTNYSNRTASVNVSPGNNTVFLTNEINNLTATMGYHYRLVASNQAGVVRGVDQGFGVAKVLWAWGNNLYNQGTNFNTIIEYTNQVIPAITNVDTNGVITIIPETTNEVPSHTNYFKWVTNAVGIAAGYYHDLGIDIDGSVVAWGDSNAFQAPAPPDLFNAIQVAGGDIHSVALFDGGNVLAWGDNTFGQLDFPSGLDDVIAIASGGYHTLALRKDGTVVAWGANNAGQTDVPAGLANVVKIAAGFDFSMALKNDGTVTVWGSGINGETNPPVEAIKLTSITAGRRFCAGLRQDGGVVVWGDLGSGVANFPTNLAGTIDIVAGNFHLLGLKNDGRIIAWGTTNSGQTRVLATCSNVFALAGGQYHSMALASDIVPVAIAKTNPITSTTTLNVVLTAQDPDFDREADRMTFIIKVPPQRGTLYQWDASRTNRGPAILLPNTVVTDPNGRLVYVPDVGGYGYPYATYVFTAFDGVLESARATNVINIDGPPFAVTLPATATNQSMITLNGLVTPNKFATTCYFQWGQSQTNYQYMTDPMDVGAGTFPTNVSVDIAYGLKIGQTYYYRVVAYNSKGTNYGAQFSVAVPVPRYSISTISMSPTNTLLRFNAYSNAVYKIWASTNLVNWSQIGVATTNSPGSFQFIDSTMTNYPQRFYQICWP